MPRAWITSWRPSSFFTSGSKKTSYWVTTKVGRTPRGTKLVITRTFCPEPGARPGPEDDEAPVWPNGCDATPVNGGSGRGRCAPRSPPSSSAKFPPRLCPPSCCSLAKRGVGPLVVCGMSRSRRGSSRSRRGASRSCRGSSRRTFVCWWPPEPRSSRRWSTFLVTRRWIALRSSELRCVRPS